MSNQDRLLSGEELYNNIHSIVEYIEFLDDNKSYQRKRNKLMKELVELIQCQKRLYAESVIGEDDTEHNKDFYGRKYDVKLRNNLRAEQRARIK